MFKQINIHKRVFIYYSLIISTIILSVMIIVYTCVANMITYDALNNMRYTVDKTIAQLEELIDKMDTLSSQIIYSSTVSNIMLEAALSNQDENYFFRNPSQASLVTSVMVSINSYKMLSPRICLFNNLHNFISVGISMDDNWDYISHRLRNSTWEKEALALGGKALLIPPHYDEWLEKDKAPIVLSLARSIEKSVSGNSLGFVEVQMPYSSLDKIINTSLSLKTASFIIFDSKGVLAYPFLPNNTDSKFSFYKQFIKGIHGSEKIINPHTGNTEEICYATSQVTGWTLFLAIPKKDLSGRMVFVRNLTFFLGLILIIFTSIFIYITSDMLTAPIRNLTKSVQKITLENFSIESDNQYGNEVIQLKTTFEKIIEKLKKSAELMIELKTREIHAHYTTLESQMNPHFIFNTIATISVIAQKIGSGEIAMICSQLSDMLRYTSSKSTSNVMLNDELRHADTYLKLIKWRFEDRIRYSITINERNPDIMIPKLIIQPLVENCLAHGFNNSPLPWCIDIKGTVTDNVWSVQVCDNGSGINPSKLEEILQGIENCSKNISEGSFSNNLEFGGMALQNIFVRLKIYYGEHAQFSIQSNKDQGTTVTIGGTIKI